MAFGGEVRPDDDTPDVFVLEEDEEDGEHPEAPLGNHCGRWGIGSESCPLSAENLCTPDFTEEFRSACDKWADRIEDTIVHKDGVLPFEIARHHQECALGACCKSPGYGEAVELLAAFQRYLTKASVCDLFWCLAAEAEV